MDDGGETRPRGWFRTLLLGAPLAAVLYVLSIGPVAAILAKMNVGDKAVEMWRYVYAPLIWLHDNTALMQPLEWYVRLWVGD